jgi:AcrR family transcriptional regulator
MIIVVYRTSIKIQEHKDAKKRHILDTAAGIFAVKGYYNTKITDILAKAGISTGSFYFYFNNKEELFEILYDEMMNAYLHVLQDAVDTMTDNADHDDHLANSICKAITLSLRTFQKNKELARITLIGAVGLNPQFEQKRVANHQRISGIFEGIFSELGKKGMVSTPDAKIAALLFTGSIYNTITDWLQEGNPVNLVEGAFPLAVYNIQALGIKFNDFDLKHYIQEI